MTEPICASCPWWQRHPDRVRCEAVTPGGPAVEERTPSEGGECRKLPPLHVLLDDGSGGLTAGHTFPVTDAETWCGEHPDRRRSTPSS